MARARVALIIALAVVLVSLQWRLWAGDGGRREVNTLRSAVAELQREADGLKERNRALQAQITDLKTGLDAIEELARSRYGMLHPDEVYYHLDEE